MFAWLHCIEIVLVDVERELFGHLFYNLLRVCGLSLAVPVLVKKCRVSLVSLQVFVDRMKIVLGLVSADAVVAVQVVLHLDPEDSSMTAHSSEEALIAAPDADGG